MSIPAILGALVLELKDATDLAVSGTEVVYYVIGMAVAAVVGYVCIKTMLVIVRKEVHRFCHLLSARWRIVHRRVFLSGITVLEVSKFWQQGIKEYIWETKGTDKPEGSTGRKKKTAAQQQEDLPGRSFSGSL